MGAYQTETERNMGHFFRMDAFSDSLSLVDSESPICSESGRHESYYMPENLMCSSYLAGEGARRLLALLDHRRIEYNMFVGTDSGSALLAERMARMSMAGFGFVSDAGIFGKEWGGPYALPVSLSVRSGIGVAHVVKALRERTDLLIGTKRELLCTDAVCLIDCECGAVERLADIGVHLHGLFTFDELLGWDNRRTRDMRDMRLRS